MRGKYGRYIIRLCNNLKINNLFQIKSTYWNQWHEINILLPIDKHTYAHANSSTN